VDEGLVELGRAYDVRVPLLTLLAERLAVKANDALKGVPHIDRISFRVKERNSFLRKASLPKYSEPLTQLEDQVAGRVITFFRDDLEPVREHLCRWFGDVEHEVKEPVGPTEFGYESHHFVFVISEHWKPDGWTAVEKMPTTFELQIRTLFMHAWAEPQHDLGYKGVVDVDTKRELAWIAASAWGADRTLNEIAGRMQSL
jgi:putative GTP pyrophosphokinase